MTTIPQKIKPEILKKLIFLYGDKAEAVYDNLEQLLLNYLTDFKDKFQKSSEKSNEIIKFTKNDIILNCYADSVRNGKNSPLKSLQNFSKNHLKNIINGVHILPFYKWDTDRGFSVLNFYDVDQRNGSWEEFTSLSEIFDILMVDCVLNHASIDNPIVQKSLIGHPDYKDFVISFDIDKKPDETELLKITRARPNPVLTKYYIIQEESNIRASFDKPNIRKILKTGWVWTTFSRPDNSDGSVATRQVDLNFNNPDLMLEMVNLILFYISKGATWIRLDAVGYLWKKIGTTCLHLPETHAVIELLVEIFSCINNNEIVLISEVNEPQEKTLQYLGSENIRKSDMIYLFTHYPLAVHAILTGTAKHYNNWLPSLTDAKGRLFVSVLGTHDGMGMKPIGDWLPDDEKEKLKKILVSEHQSLPNYAQLPGGEKIIYELCSTPWNFINSSKSKLPIETQIDRYLAVFAMGLMVKGVPSIYINGLLGIPNFEGKLDENRSINRQFLQESNIQSELSNHDSKTYQIFEKIKKLIDIRKNESAFNLDGKYKVLNLNEKIVSILFTSLKQSESIIALVNVTNITQKVLISLDNKLLNKKQFNDLISEKNYEKSKNLIEIDLKPYQICWLK